jgi:beta-glucosidase-like glycosyl hydrolase
VGSCHSRTPILTLISSLFIAGCALFQGKVERSPNSETLKKSFVKEVDLSTWTLKEKIGQLLLVGYRDDQQIKEMLPGGVALFSWSMKSVSQTRELTKKIRELGDKNLKAPLLIATDHEGGRVIRLRDGMTLFPEASVIGTSNDIDLSRRVGQAVGKELAYLGIDANFAPVLDLGGAESFLGNRVWGHDAGEVANMTGAYIQGLHDVGVISVAKHFPGHGPSPEDAHFSVPVNHKKLVALWEEDLHPFKQAVIEKVPAMMTAHVRVPEVDRLPASMSPRFLSRILRDTFQFEGVIITDDLEMKGAQESRMTPGDLALQSLVAGSDMLLIVWSKKDQRQTIERVEKAIRSGEWSESELDRKVQRILRLKSNWIGGQKWKEAHNQALSPLRSKKHLAIVDEINSQPFHWSGLDSSKVLKQFSSARHKQWRVALPKGSYVSYWRSFRPHDEVYMHEPRMSSAHEDLIKTKFSPKECLMRNCLVLTESATRSSAPFYRHLKSVIQSDLTSSSSGAGAFVWAHMGLKPPVTNMSPNASLVILGGTGLPRFRQLSLELQSK